MHDTAALVGHAFFRAYGDPLENPRILEVGSGSSGSTGSLREYKPKNCEYVGIDLREGPGVDLVVKDFSRTYPYLGGLFDLVVSNSCFEHDEMFWETFNKMCLVLKPGGYIYVNTPRSGAYHAEPVDCWRFYKDAAPALARWARWNGQEIEVVENFAEMPMRHQWIDQVMVFGKKPIFKTVDTIHSWLDNQVALFIFLD